MRPGGYAGRTYWRYFRTRLLLMQGPTTMLRRFMAYYKDLEKRQKKAE